MTAMTTDIQPGDVVDIVEHRRAPELYPTAFYTIQASSGWVVQSTKRVFVADGESLRLVRMDDCGEHKFEWVHPDYARLVTKGRGQFEYGVDIPFSKLQLAQQRYQVFKDRVDRAMLQVVADGYQGYPNAATFLAALYLRQEPKFHAQLGYLRRKDGTVNPKKVQKAFHDLRLKVDEWAYACPVDVPDEFARHSLSLLVGLRVDWAVVANDFAEAAHA